MMIDQESVIGWEGNAISAQSILVVDDDLSLSRLIVKRLRRENFLAETASSGAEAVSRMIENPGRLLLLDYQLSDMTGKQVIETLGTVTPGVPFIIMTGHGDERTAVEMMRLGARDYIVKDGNFLELLPMVVDRAIQTIETDRRLAEARKALEESEKRYRTLIEHQGEGVCVLDPDGRFSFANPAAEEIFGVSHGSLVSSSLRSFMDPESFARVLQRQDSPRDNGKNTYELEIQHQDGARRCALVTSTSRGNGDGKFWILRDITERKRTEEALRESNLLNESLLRTIPYGMQIVSEDGTILFNRHAFDGNLDNGVVGKRCWSVYKDDRQQCGTCPLREGISVGETKIIETEGVLGGKVFQITHTGMIYRGSKAVLEILQDISERKLAEEALRTSEDSLRVIFNSVNDAIFVHGLDGTIVDVNDKMLEMYGVGRGEAASLSIRDDYSSPQNPLEKLPGIWQRVLGGENQLFEWKARRPGDGSIFDVEVFLRRIALRGKSVILATVRDITERKRIEQELAQAKKMESIITVVGSIAHDFNNILNNVLAIAVLTKKYVHDHARTLKYCDALEQSVARGDNLANQLLAIGEERRPEQVQVNLIEVIHDVGNALQKTLPGGISLVKNIDLALNNVRGNSAELRQALMNLCLNAVEAMTANQGSDSVGRLTIDAKNVPADPEIASRLAVQYGAPCIHIGISDTGAGIPDSIRDRIFDPFFTTKKVDRGAGLGLSIVYSIMRTHGGAVTFESIVGQGTTFNMYLPAIPELKEIDRTTAVPVLPSKGNELILLVDDEPGMREYGRDLLQQDGYRVMVASDGVEAVKIYQQHPQEIALVVLDLVMPNKDGGTTFLEMKNINPGVKALFCSGYVSDQVIQALLAEEKLRAIQKPVRPEELLKAVREVLDGR